MTAFTVYGGDKKTQIWDFVKRYENANLSEDGKEMLADLKGLLEEFADG